MEIYYNMILRKQRVRGSALGLWKASGQDKFETMPQTKVSNELTRCLTSNRAQLQDISLSPPLSLYIARRVYSFQVPTQQVVHHLNICMKSYVGFTEVWLAG